MLNKSLVLRNKFYRFCFLIFSLFLFIYLFFFLFNGEKGIFSYYKITNKHDKLYKSLTLLENHNKKLEDKISRLSINTLDLDYLDEQLRSKTGRIKDNEIVINLDN